jgi:hypothetical protein
MSKFAHIKERYETRNRVVRYTLPIKGARDPKTGEHLPAVLLLKHAGESNRGYNNALIKNNAQTGLARKAMTGRGGDIALERDLELYPQHVITGWENIPDQNWNAVPYSREDCADFVQNGLQRWIFNELRLFAVQAVNFVDDDVPTSDEVKDAGGN